MSFQAQKEDSNIRLHANQIFTLKLLLFHFLDQSVWQKKLLYVFVIILLHVYSDLPQH